MSTPDEVRKNLLIALPHLRFAIEEGKKKAGDGCTVEIGILVRNADGSGRIVSSLAGEFIEDLATLLGAGPLTDAERQDAKAEKLIQEFGLR
jgi:hypothetical protein